MKSLALTQFLIGLIFLAATLFASADTAQLSAEQSLRVIAERFFEPLPESMAGSEKDTPEQIALGRALYFETELSVNGSQSCNSCHNIETNSQGKSGNGADEESKSIGATGIPGKRNSPTTWNAGLQTAQFWDARATTLEEQARSPLLNPDEMALVSEENALQKLKGAGYEPIFTKAFPESLSALSFGNLISALAAFQRTLISKDRFDDYLIGDDNALSAQEKRGLEKFVRTGCNGCHNGPLLGGTSIMKLGIAHPYPNGEDTGRAQVTGKRGDRYFFKVPPLRNVGLTAPYFHDGAETSLKKAVAATAWHQLGITMSDEDAADISAFLRSLDNTL